MTFITFCYDIPNDHRRNRVARILASVADRVQYSVFEGYLDENTLNRTIRKLSRTINPHEDTIRIYRICATCRQQITLLGKGQLTEKPKDVIIID